MTAPVASTPDVQEHSALFLLDFVARYAVDRCHARDTFFTGVLSFVCILPFLIWLCSFILMLTKVELYWAMAKYTITLLTILTLLLLFIYDTPPPVLGCGPDQSFPSPQAALASYAYCTFRYYINMARDKYSEFVNTLLICNIGIVVISLLHLGMASPSSVLAGSVLGSVIACLLHETLLNLIETPGMLTRFVFFLESKLGIYTVDTLLQSLQLMQDMATMPVTEQKKERLNEQIFENNIRTQAKEEKGDSLLEHEPLVQLVNPNKEVVALGRFNMGYREP